MAAMALRAARQVRPLRPCAFCSASRRPLMVLINLQTPDCRRRTLPTHVHATSAPSPQCMSPLPPAGAWPAPAALLNASRVVKCTYWQPEWGCLAGPPGPPPSVLAGLPGPCRKGGKHAIGQHPPGAIPADMPGGRQWHQGVRSVGCHKAAAASGPGRRGPGVVGTCLCILT